MGKAFLVSLFVFGLASCSGIDNQAACLQWESTIHCAPDGGTGEPYDVSKAIDCSVYKDKPCDLAPFWKCLTDNFHCTNGVANTTYMNSSCHTKGECKL
jgi:hypothetical protein